jgi:uncharacterized protein YbbC (DUF1343 family)
MNISQTRKMKKNIPLLHSLSLSLPKFYIYINAMLAAMIACSQSDIMLMILDQANLFNIFNSSFCRPS